MVQGWANYYGRFHASALRRVPRTLDDFLVRWAQRKYTRLHAHTGQAWKWLWRVRARQPALLPIGRWDHRLDDRRRMNREVHVRFWEGLAVRFRWATQLPHDLLAT